MHEYDRIYPITHFGGDFLDTLQKITLREARKNKGLSSKELAEVTGLSVAVISHIENGRSDGSSTKREVADALCDALDVEVKGIEWPNGLTSVGRMPYTGGVYTVSDKEPSPPPRLCPNPACNAELPKSSDDCFLCG